MPTGRATSARAWAPATAGYVVVLVALVLLAGCGLSAGRPAEPVAVPTGRSDGPGPAPTAGWREIDLYFVDGARLAAVSRRVADAGPQRAAELLLTGPTRSEAAGGLRTALAPQAVSVSSGPVDPGTVTVTVGRQFTAMAGSNQLLAVAQLVWTVTQFPQVEGVRFVLEGSLVEVPTDRGLSGRPVDRAGYRSVAPRAGG
jgi:hypothetical protein